MLLSVDEFITEDERLDILCRAYSATEDDWKKQDGGGAYWIGNRYPFECSIFTDLNQRITKYFANYERISPFCAIQRIGVGNGMGEHTDNYHDTCAFGCVVYLNNNFEGGNLFYPRTRQSLEPVPGRLVVHAANEPHSVETVTKGTRYMLTCFVYQHPDTFAELIRDN
jgi:hypothetical protein